MRNNQILKAGLIAAAVSLSACATANNKEHDAYNMLLAETMAAVEKAASVKGEWRDIRWKKSKIKLLPNAKKAAAKGDYAKAMKLLKAAKMQAELGYAQAMDQKNAGPRF